jgi:AcrR family transcriptional regulator
MSRGRQRPVEKGRWCAYANSHSLEDLVPNYPGQRKGGHYHHGDLRTALIEAAIQLIGERGVREFSMAEASRRLGVAVSAPYAHFADRDQLLAAVAVQAYERFYEALVPYLDRTSDPAECLAAMTGAYVRFAATNRPLFEVLYTAGLDKSRYPEIEAAERPLLDALLGCVRTVCEGDETLCERLASAVEAAAHGHALFLLYGDFGQGEEAVEQATERASRTTLALVESRRLLRQ